MLHQHPTAVAHRSLAPRTPPRSLDAARLRQVLIDAGADDAAAISLSREELDEERPHALGALPGARTLVSFCLRMNHDQLRSPARSLANNEFHHTGEAVDEIARRAVRTLQELGLRAVAPAMGFPMEMDAFPGRTWVISHKRVAVAAGLGAMGIHRNVIHPRFGNFILLGTVLLDREVASPAEPLDFNPCLECKLCVAACPVGAISPDGEFAFSACYTHNYREFMGGFTDWVEELADSRDAADYRERVSDSESASMWQSLSFGANYKAAYCMAVCPAGVDVIAPFLDDRGEFLRRVVQPLKDKVEPLYVVPGSDAEAHAKKRFAHKRTRAVHSGLRPGSVQGFALGLPLVFQKQAAGDLDAVYHFEFSGAEVSTLTVVIRAGKLEVEQGLIGTPDLLVRADARAWIRFLRGELGILRALLTRKVRLRGPARLLRAFGRCFV